MPSRFRPLLGNSAARRSCSRHAVAWGDSLSRSPTLRRASITQRTSRRSRLARARWHSDRGDCHSALVNGDGLPPLAGCPMRTPMAIETAVILAGAVAKGAFEAGALEVLAPHAEALRITRLVGASAGSLNASVFAVGLRARAEREVAKKLV